MSIEKLQSDAAEHHLPATYNQDENYAQTMESLPVTHAPVNRSRSLLDDDDDGLTLRFSEITQFPLPAGEYMAEEAPKKQIYIHHTAGWGSGAGTINGWIGDSVGRVGTFLCISGRTNHRTHRHRDGELVQAFSSRHWAWHLGVSTANRTALNKESIGIELASWGQLEKLQDGNFVPQIFYSVDEANIREAYKIPPEHVVTYPDGFRGFKHYEKYTDAQIASLRTTLLYLGKTYDIPLDYHEDMWDVSEKALKGEPGIWAHVSVRTKGKWDCHPQPELIAMLQGLKDVDLDQFKTED
jgi:hypothetical protein